MQYNIILISHLTNNPPSILLATLYCNIHQITIRYKRYLRILYLRSYNSFRRFTLRVIVFEALFDALQSSSHCLELILFVALTVCVIVFSAFIKCVIVFVATDDISK